MTSEQRLEETRKQGKSPPGRVVSTCKGPEVEKCLAYLKNSEEASVARMEHARRSVVRDEAKKIPISQFMHLEGLKVVKD